MAPPLIILPLREAMPWDIGFVRRPPGDHLAYAVTYDGLVSPQEVDNDRIGIRPAFVAVQE